jgi:hypothetical protein
MDLQSNITPYGAGHTPSHELPNKMSTSSSPSDLKMNKQHRDKLYKQLQHLLDFNEKIVGFCNLPSSIVTLTVLPENECKLYRKQYNLPIAIIPLVTKTVND